MAAKSETPTEQFMSGADFRAWVGSMGLTNPQAAHLLGVSTATIYKYRTQPGPIPYPVALACAALSAGLGPWRPPAPTPAPEAPKGKQAPSAVPSSTPAPPKAKTKAKASPAKPPKPTKRFIFDTPERQKRLQQFINGKW